MKPTAGDSRSRDSSAPSTKSRRWNLAASASSFQGRSIVISCRGGAKRECELRSESQLVVICNYTDAGTSVCVCVCVHVCVRVCV